MRLSARKIGKQEDGLGMLEFALIIPVVFIIVAGLIDYGHVIRQLNTLSLIARDAGRAASTHSRTGRNSTPGELQVMCENPAARASTVACNASTAALTIRNYEAADPTRTPDSVEMAAKKAACLGLQSAKLDAREYEITTDIQDIPESPADPTSYKAKELRLNINFTGTNCLLCWGRLVAGVAVRGDSNFVLEDKCR